MTTRLRLIIAELQAARARGLRAIAAAPNARSKGPLRNGPLPPSLPEPDEPDERRDAAEWSATPVRGGWLEHFSIRLGVSRVREISVAFFFGNTFEK